MGNLIRIVTGVKIRFLDLTVPLTNQAGPRFMLNIPVVPALAATAIVLSCAGHLARNRIAQWRRVRWMRQPPRTGQFYGSSLKVGARVLVPFGLFALALALWLMAVPWLFPINRVAAGFVALLGAIPAYMGFAGWAGPGKLAARNLRLTGGEPILTLDESGFDYLSFARISWREVYQIQYFPKEPNGMGEVVAVQLADATRTVLSGVPLDQWAQEQYTQEACRWLQRDAGQWLFLDLRLLAGASPEKIGYWMMALRQKALSTN